MKLASLVMLTMTLAAVLAACGSGHTSTPTSAAGRTAPRALASVIGTPEPPLVKIVSTSGGKKVLADMSGKSLYTRNDDKPSTGVTNCTGDCLKTWLPLMFPCSRGCDTPQTPGLSGPLGSFARSDSNPTMRQVLYKGKPLYRYAGDKSPGDTNGDGVDNQWSVARP